MLFNTFGTPLHEVPNDGRARRFIPNGKAPDIIELRWLWHKENPHCYKIASGLAALQICDIAVELPREIYWRDYCRRVETLPVRPAIVA